MGVLRYKPITSPDKLDPYEEYALIDGLDFIKKGLSFPTDAKPITHLEHVFLVEAYKVHYEATHGSIYSEEFEKGMQELKNTGGT